MGVPQNGWFVREHPTRMDDDWGVPRFEEETSICKNETHTVQLTKTGRM